MTFDDGLVTIYNVENVADAGDMPKRGLALYDTFFFHEEALGVTRFYEAIKAGQLIERVIAIPWPASLSINQIAVFEDNTQFQIKMLQLTTDENGLKTIKLSLERNGENYEVIK